MHRGIRNNERQIAKHSDMREVSLADKFDLANGTIFITGKQALSRVPLLQRELDNRRGLRTAGYISGYRGRPSVQSITSS